MHHHDKFENSVTLWRKLGWGLSQSCSTASHDRAYRSRPSLIHVGSAGHTLRVKTISLAVGSQCRACDILWRYRHTWLHVCIMTRTDQHPQHSYVTAEPHPTSATYRTRGNMRAIMETAPASKKETHNDPHSHGPSTVTLELLDRMIQHADSVSAGYTRHVVWCVVLIGLWLASYLAAYDRFTCHRVTELA